MASWSYREKIIAELSEKLSLIPGYVPGFLQPIENRILMLSTGIRAQVGIKVLGSDLETIQQVAFKIEELVRQVPGAMREMPRPKWLSRCSRKLVRLWER